MSSSVPPRFTHPYGSDHMDRHAMSVCNRFSLFAILLCIPNIFSLFESQLFRLSQLIQRVLHISLSANVFKITRHVISLVSVYMVNLTILRSIANKCRRYHSMDCLMKIRFIYRQGHKQIAVRAKRGAKNVCGVFIRSAAQNFTYDGLTYAKQRRYLSSTFTRFTKQMYFMYLRVCQSTLRFISRAHAFYAAKITDVVCSFKTHYRFPSFHLSTPNS